MRGLAAEARQAPAAARSLMSGELERAITWTRRVNASHGPCGTYGGGRPRRVDGALVPEDVHVIPRFDEAVAGDYFARNGRPVAGSGCLVAASVEFPEHSELDLRTGTLLVRCSEPNGDEGRAGCLSYGTMSLSAASAHDTA